jgi:hypothetical protein
MIAPLCRHVHGRETTRNDPLGRHHAFRSHPALLAWYVNAESTIERVKALRMHYELLERIDPDHPTWTVLYQYDMMRAMAPTFDILGVDIYPVTTSPLSAVTQGEC